MTRCFLRILFFVIYFSLLRCSSGKNDGIRAAPPPNTLTKFYSFTSATCSTGEHVFSGNNESLILRDFCGALKDDALNQFCASDERANLYTQNQCDLISDWVFIEKGDKNQGAQKSFESSTRPNPIFAFDEITPTVHSLSSLKLRLQFLWATQTKNFISRIAKDWQSESESILRDFLQCGFDYFGPNCLEGQKKTLLYEGTFTNSGVGYAFFTFSYSESPQIFSLLFPLDENNQVLAERSKGYIFGVANKDRVHDAQFIFGKNSSIPLGEVSFRKLTPQNYHEFVATVHDSRSQIRLAFYEDELTHFLNEHGGKGEKLKADEIALRLAGYGINEELLDEREDHNALFLYFKYFYEHSSTGDYRKFLEISRHSSLKKMVLHAQLATIRLGLLNAEDVPALIKALGQDDQELIRIAFWSIESLTFIPSPLKVALARLLGDEREYIQIKAADILIKFALDAPSVVKVSEVISRKSKTPPIYLRALDVLSSSSLPEVNRNIVSIIDHRDADLRRALGLFLQERMPLEDTLLPDLGQLVESPYPDNRIVGLTLINSLPSEEATLVLVQKFLKIDATLHDYLIKILLSRNNYSDMHVNDLAKLQPRKEADLSFTGLELMLRIKSPLAANAIIDTHDGWLTNMNDKKDSDLIDYTLERLYAFTFSPINAFNLGSFKHEPYRKFNAMINFLISIDGDNDEVSSVLIDFIVGADDVQREKIYRHLESRILGGDCLLKLVERFLKGKPAPKSPKQQINFEKTIEFINEREHIGAQFALVAAMGMEDPTVRSWAVSRLDVTELDASIGDKLAYYLTGELGTNDGDILNLKGLSPYGETREAATKYLVETLSPEGFTRLMEYLVIVDQDRSGLDMIPPSKRDEYADLLEYYLRSLHSYDDISDAFLEEVYHGLKHGDLYGQLLMLKLLPLIPRCDVFEKLKLATTLVGLTPEFLAALNATIAEMETTLGFGCLVAVK